MKQTKVCPKCGGREIAVMRGDLVFDCDPRVRVTEGFYLSHDDFLPVERYLCCTCGYMESWVDAGRFIKKGGRRYWEEKDREDREFEERQSRRGLAGQEKQNRGDGPWN